MEYSLEFCRMTVGLVFAVAFLGKVRSPRALARTISKFDLLPRRAATPVAYLFLAGEGAVVVLMTAAGTPLRIGFTLSFLMLAAFSAALASALRRDLDISCNCFGASETRLSRAHLVRNAGFMACALGGLAISGTNPAALGAWELSLVALATAVFVAVWSQLDQVVSLLR